MFEKPHALFLLLLLYFQLCQPIRQEHLYSRECNQLICGWSETCSIHTNYVMHYFDNWFRRCSQRWRRLSSEALLTSSAGRASQGRQFCQASAPQCFWVHAAWVKGIGRAPLWSHWNFYPFLVSVSYSENHFCPINSPSDHNTTNLIPSPESVPIFHVANLGQSNFTIQDLTSLPTSAKKRARTLDSLTSQHGANVKSSFRAMP